MTALKTLADHAEAFATELTSTFRGVFGESMPEFVAEASPRRDGTTQRLLVHPKDSVDICLEIGGAHALTLICDYHCIWDHQATYLKVTKANVHVRPATDATPLFRYEFEDSMQAALPCAHLQIHAHRDEFLFAMLRAGRGKPAIRVKAATGESKAAVPRLSNLHFPLGGARMRPCVEDVLQMLVSEFAVTTVPGAQAVLDAGRARWRRHQIGASVRDAPAEAVRVLEGMGYTVVEPAEGPRFERLDRLTRF
ncbi:hypothetical protein GCM10022199_26010 [Marihabitans asiaticum]|uniref:Uncharacterized protein n=1 Tax=Marihabitans asiaticum TaxID=415218 RepID=A0A560WH26_9MICO|nr:hypothetical protein [Marihabitans asiaticum]TWD16785.1 hypothetical protein FB557_0322 [Marihabitans asiaticum]